MEAQRRGVSKHDAILIAIVARPVGLFNKSGKRDDRRLLLLKGHAV